MPPEVSPLLDEAYPALRRIARGLVAREPAASTLSGTALLNESLLKLLQYRGHAVSKQHLMALVVVNMRRILVDRARRRRSLKRTRPEPVLPVILPEESGSVDVRQAFEKLCQLDPVAGQVVKYHIFEGHTLRETADQLGLTVSSVRVLLSFSESWLRERLGL